MIEPRGKMVLIRPEKIPNISDLIVMAEDTGLKPQAKGEVLAIGPDVSQYIRVGDTVYFEAFDWTRATEDTIIIAEGEIMARDGRKNS